MRDFSTQGLMPVQFSGFKTDSARENAGMIITLYGFSK